MSSATRRLECRASLLALAIATAGASVHVAILAFAAPEESAPLLECPGRLVAMDAVPVGATAQPEYLAAVERRCSLSGATRCEIAQAIDRNEALARAEDMLGARTADHAFLRFAPEFGRIVWSVRDLDAGQRAELDAFDGRALEYAIDVRED